MNKMLRSLLVLLVAGGTIVACSSTKEPAPAPVVEQPASAPVVQEASAPAKILNHNAVFFKFDKYNIDDQYKGIIKANADYLASSKDAKVQVQGNADSVGSVEYNLSLGQKRANAVKKALIVLGACDVRHGGCKSRIETISYGKLQPKYPNDNDMDRAKNRRADVVYKDSGSQPKGYQVQQSLPWVDSDFYSGTVVEGIQ